MRKEIVYFNGGWYAMLFGYITQMFLTAMIENPIVEFIIAFITFASFFFLGLFICSKVWKEPKSKKELLDCDECPKKYTCSKSNPSREECKGRFDKKE